MTRPSRGSFTVTMLGVLEEPFQAWLAKNNLMAATLPGENPDHYIVVPRSLPGDNDGHQPVTDLG